MFTASLKIQGVDAQNHAVFAELKRIQQYFAKIKAAEEPAGQRKLVVNQEAATRMLKADLVSCCSCHISRLINYLDETSSHLWLTISAERQQAVERQAG
jgi:hypothetical protein